MKPKEEIIEELAFAEDAIDGEENKFFGMTYEQGVKAALEWVLDYTDERPMEDYLIKNSIT